MIRAPCRLDRQERKVEEKQRETMLIFNRVHPRHKVAGVRVLKGFFWDSTLALIPRDRPPRLQRLAILRSLIEDAAFRQIG